MFWVFVKCGNGFGNGRAFGDLFVFVRPPVTVGSYKIGMHRPVGYVNKKWFRRWSVFQPVDGITRQFIGDVSFLRHPFPVDVKPFVAVLGHSATGSPAIRPAGALSFKTEPVVKTGARGIGIAHEREEIILRFFIYKIREDRTTPQIS